MPYLFSSILGALLWLVSLPLSAAVLQVFITSLDNTQGDIMVAVYDSEATFLKEDGRVAEAKLPAADAQESRVVATFEKLTLNKKYAIAVFHDANSNQVLDKGLFGIPKEGYGFSNNARGWFGPPSFDDAAFLLDQDNKAISLYLSY
jgi:uncharacterized protein (DUF2141 family)